MSGQSIGMLWLSWSIQIEQDFAKWWVKIFSVLNFLVVVISSFAFTILILNKTYIVLQVLSEQWTSVLKYKIAGLADTHTYLSSHVPLVWPKVEESAPFVQILPQKYIFCSSNENLHLIEWTFCVEVQHCRLGWHTHIPCLTYTPLVTSMHIWHCRVTGLADTHTYLATFVPLVWHCSYSLIFLFISNEKMMVSNQKV